jgi:hypothetical protein
MTIQNAVITRTFLGFEGHGILTSGIYLEMDGTCQMFGGFTLRGEYMAIWIEKILEITEKESWEELKGVSVRIDGDFDKIYRIGHFIKDKWFSLESLKQKAL